jgi:hypothetical protein
MFQLFIVIDLSEFGWVRKKIYLLVVKISILVASCLSSFLYRCGWNLDFWLSYIIIIVVDCYMTIDKMIF